MLTASILFLLVAPSQALAVRQLPTDYELTEACVRWFYAYDFSRLNVVHNPKWRRLLESQDKKLLIPRLETVRDGRIHAVAYSAVSFVLAYLGREPALNTRRMLATMEVGRPHLPSNVDDISQDGRPGMFGVVDPIKGFYDSTIQLYEREKRDDVLAEILGLRSDGETSYFYIFTTQALLLKHPSAVLRVAWRRGLCTAVGRAAARERIDPKPIRNTLRTMSRDRRSEVRNGAKKVAEVFENVWQKK